MKQLKTLGSFLFIFFVQIGFAQSSIFQIRDNSNNNQIVNDGAVFYHVTKANGPTINHEFEIKNISAQTVSLSLRKYEDLLNTVNLGSNDVAQAYFCFGTNCLPSSVFSYSIELGVGESTLLEAKFEEASIAGHSSVRYKINDKTNASDALMITLKYDTNVGIESTLNEAFSFSQVYPNPNNGNFCLNILKGETIIQNIKLMNTSGQIIASDAFDYVINEGVINLKAKQLNAGIYFVQLYTDKNIISKKITINN